MIVPTLCRTGAAPHWFIATHSVPLAEQAGEQLNVGLASMRQLPLAVFSSRTLPGLTLSATLPPNWL